MSTLKVNTIQDAAGSRSIDVKTGVPQLYRIADASDVVLATCASGGTRVGGSFVATIPTNGKIRVVVDQMQLNGTSGMGSIGLAIEVNGVTYFLQNFSVNQNASPTYVPGTMVTNTGWGSSYSICRGGNIASSRAPFVIDFDVATIGCATGSQTCYVRLGGTADSAAPDTLTVKGTATPTRIHVEVLGA